MKQVSINKMMDNICKCGHPFYPNHHPGAEWNADQRAVHHGCQPPCPCTDYMSKNYSHVEPAKVDESTAYAEMPWQDEPTYGECMNDNHDPGCTCGEGRTDHVVTIDQAGNIDPKHYTERIPRTKKYPNGIECIDVARWFDYPLGATIKYIWRAGFKGEYIEQLRKARRYLDFAIETAELRKELEK